jgi:hypothetical protein
MTSQSVEVDPSLPLWQALAAAMIAALSADRLCGGTTLDRQLNR